MATIQLSPEVLNFLKNFNAEFRGGQLFELYCPVTFRRQPDWPEGEFEIVPYGGLITEERLKAEKEYKVRQVMGDKNAIGLERGNWAYVFNFKEGKWFLSAFPKDPSLFSPYMELTKVSYIQITTMEDFHNIAEILNRQVCSSPYLKF